MMDESEGILSQPVKIAIGVVVVIAAILGGYYWYRQHPDVASSAKPAEAPSAPAPAAAAPADQQTSNQPAQLPQTASELPLMALIGMLSLAGAASLRVILKMTA